MRKFNIKVNGVSYAVEVEEQEGGASAPVQTAAAVAVPAPATSVSAAKPSAPAGGSAVTAPMPGDIRKLNFVNGATVKTGDKVAVLEAMKMENDIVSMSAGVITYTVSEGDHIDTGAVIAYIK